MQSLLHNIRIEFGRNDVSKIYLIYFLSINFDDFTSGHCPRSARDPGITICRTLNDKKSTFDMGHHTNSRI